MTTPGTTPDATETFGRIEVGYLLVLSSMWGLSFLFIELALRQLGPVWIVAGRTVTGGLVLVAVLRLRGGLLPRGVRVWGHLLLLGSINNALPWAAVAWAQQSLPSGLVALLMAVVPTSTLLVAAALRMETITPPRLGGLLLAAGGVAVIVGGDVEDTGRLLAIGAVVGATLLYAVGAVHAKRHLSGVLRPLELATGQVICAALVAVPVALLLEGPPPGPTELTATTLTAVAALGVFGTGAAFTLFYVLIERVGATNTTMTTYLIPVVAIIAGTLVLGERLGWPVAVGGGLIAFGIWLSQRPARPSRGGHDAEALG